MSSLTVRNVIRSALSAYLSGLGVPFPFYDTINETQQPNDNLWCSVDFIALSNEHNCYDGTRRIERGIATISIYGRPGVGDLLTTAAAELMRDYFDGFSSSGVVVMNVIPSNEITSGSAQNYYGVEIQLEYDYYNS